MASSENTRAAKASAAHSACALAAAPCTGSLEEDECDDLERVLAADGCLDAGYKLVQRFRVALHELDVPAVKQWLLDAAASDLKPFSRLAAGMTDDLEAISNAFRYPSSTGPVEGHITRVKTVS